MSIESYWVGARIRWGATAPPATPTAATLGASAASKEINHPRARTHTHSDTTPSGMAISITNTRPQGLTFACVHCWLLLSILLWWWWWCCCGGCAHMGKDLHGFARICTDLHGLAPEAEPAPHGFASSSPCPADDSEPVQKSQQPQSAPQARLCTEVNTQDGVTFVRGGCGACGGESRRGIHPIVHACEGCVCARRLHTKPPVTAR